MVSIEACFIHQRHKIGYFTCLHNSKCRDPGPRKRHVVKAMYTYHLNHERVILHTTCCKHDVQAAATRPPAMCVPQVHQSRRRLPRPLILALTEPVNPPLHKARLTLPSLNHAIPAKPQSTTMVKVPPQKCSTTVPMWKCVCVVKVAELTMMS